MLKPTNPDILLIDNAIDSLEKNGWIQHDYQNKDGTCIYGAFSSVMQLNNTFTYREPVTLYSKLEDFSIYRNSQGVVSFNDSPGRTKEEVINFLKDFRNHLICT